MKDLIVVIPAYNEEEIIEFVIKDWIYHLNKLDINFQINVYNDGSPDNTFLKLLELSKTYKELNPVDKINSGHGPTILSGYKDVVDNADWIFQIDSDNEMKADYFYKLWKNKSEYDFLIGIRDNRNQPLSRKLVSSISRFVVKLFYGNLVNDVNSPYRLMRSSKFKSVFSIIPENTFAPNLVISGFTSKKNLKVFQIPIPHYDRETGEVSIKKWKLFKAAFKSMIQTIKISFLFK
jgi:dolichol-phosphate mannosyltransferase